MGFSREPAPQSTLSVTTADYLAQHGEALEAGGASIAERPDLRAHAGTP